jgi:two-component system, NarL family, nitrate/nitrite response regulator NarL
MGGNVRKDPAPKGDSRARPGLTLAAGPGLFAEVALGQLGREPGIDAVGRAHDERELRRLVAGKKPRVLLLDTEAIGQEWIGWIPSIRRVAPRTRTLLVSVDPTETLVKAALSVGASGVVGKQRDFKTLCTAVLRVGAGEIWADPYIPGPVRDDFDGPARHGETAKKGLTARERQVGDCVALGLRNREIANRLRISETTVKRHLQSVFRKLGEDSRLAVALRGRRLGLKA